MSYIKSCQQDQKTKNARLINHSERTISVASPQFLVTQFHVLFCLRQLRLYKFQLSAVLGNVTSLARQMNGKKEKRKARRAVCSCHLTWSVGSTAREKKNVLKNQQVGSWIRIKWMKRHQRFVHNALWVCINEVKKQFENWQTKLLNVKVLIRKLPYKLLHL